MLRSFLNFLFFLAAFMIIGFSLSSFSSGSTLQIFGPDAAWLIWLESNWAVVALIISEVSALFPGNMKGILQTIVLILSKIFETKKLSS